MSLSTAAAPTKPHRSTIRRTRASGKLRAGAVPEVNVGHRLRELRNERELSIRALAERSGLNVNTFSLIENGKTSPSVSTLQQIAAALEVPMTAFFETEVPKNSVAHIVARNRPRLAFAHGTLEDLGPLYWVAVARRALCPSRGSTYLDAPDIIGFHLRPRLGADGKLGEEAIIDLAMERDLLEQRLADFERARGFRP